MFLIILSIVQDVAVIIPSLSLDEKLLSLLADLREAQFSHILVINDGSTEDYDPFFEAARSQYGCTVLTHVVNQGKGRALKTAFNYLLSECPDCKVAVSVDSDGQHRVGDILKVAQETVDFPDSLVMGCRNFTPGNTDIPARSRFGNIVTSHVLRALCGITLSDTQTGLRGFSRKTMGIFMATNGERFEYETNMILDAKEHEIALREVPIETVYIEENRTSHFNPLKDSLRIYAVFSKFILASVSSFLLDVLLYSFFVWLLRTVIAPDMAVEQVILIAAFTARALSALFNFTVNRQQVFKSKANAVGSMVRYAILCVVQITISAFATSGLYNLLKWGTTFLKVLVDTVLFLLSFQIQRNWVFGKK